MIHFKQFLISGSNSADTLHSGTEVYVLVFSCRSSIENLGTIDWSNCNKVNQKILNPEKKLCIMKTDCINGWRIIKKTILGIVLNE